MNIIDPERNLENAVEGIFAKTEAMDFVGGFERSIRQRVPVQLIGAYDQYFGAEQIYLDNILRGIQEDTRELVREKREEYRRDPLAFEETTTIRQLFQFRDSARQKAFLTKIHEGIEDIAYAAEVAAYEAMEIYHVKSNTPLVGEFVRDAARKKLGGDPELNEFVRYIRQTKEKFHSAVKKRNGNMSYRVPSFSREQLAERYRRNVRNPHKHVVSQEYAAGTTINDKTRRPTGTVIDAEFVEGEAWTTVNPRQRFRRDMDYSLSDYNGLFFQIIGVIGSAINYVGNMFNYYLGDRKQELLR